MRALVAVLVVLVIAVALTVAAARSAGQESELPPGRVVPPQVAEPIGPHVAAHLAWRDGERLASWYRAAAAAEAEARARQAARAVPNKRATTSVTSSGPFAIPAYIVMCESGGNYRAENPRSSASGAYQFLDSTWTSVTGLAPPASAYPPAVQDAAAAKLWDGGRGASHWVCA